MSEEEKEAIDFLKDLKNLEINYFADRFMTGKVYLQDSEKEQIDKALNLISKLQKENEELKAINSMQKYRIEVIDERELISKEKIREYIKENAELKEKIKEYEIGIVKE